MEDIVKELLTRERDSLIKRLGEVEKLLGNKTQTKGDVYLDSLINDFPVNGSFINQILFILKTRNRFLHSYEIVQELLQYHKDKDEKWIRSRVSSVLSASAKDIDSLINYKYSNSLKDTVWGNKNWLNENGKIKDEHLYKVSEIKEQNKIEF